MLVVLSVFIGVVGLAVGSFLNVVIYRLPRGKSLLTPPSHCPNCGIYIKWYDNIPVLSFFLLGGKCRACKKPISWRYPLVEGVTALFFLLTFLYHHSLLFSFPLLIGLIKTFLFVSILIPVFFIDLEHQIIPDSLSYSLLVSGIILSGIQGFFFPSLEGAALGIVIFLVIFYLSIFFLHQAGMGMGDVKIAAGIGAYLGWKMALLSFFLSFFLGALVAGIFLLFHLKGMKDKIPFGPFLVAGAILTLFLGKAIVNLYFSLLW